MKKLLYICLFVLAVVIATSSTKPKLYNIQGHVTRSADWCSGVAPGPDYYNQEQNPAPYTGLKLYIKTGKSNNFRTKIYTTVITDTAGNFNLKLPVGNYIILRAEQLQKPTIPQNGMYQKWDSACVMRNWLNGTSQILVNPKSVKKITFDIREHCTWNYPCMQYSGPLPP